MGKIKAIAPDGIQTYSGWFNGSDDPVKAMLSTEATDANEVVVSIESVADYTGDRPKVDAHITAIQAIQFGERMVEAGRAAIARLELVRGLDPSQDIKRNP